MRRASSAISENSIVFFEGGHDHDGVSSSLIDTEQYSIYDFVVGKTGSNARQIRQQRNFDNLKTVISNVVINDVLGPSGVRLLPNSIQSVHIAAGAVTANELAANVILVNNIIRSDNFDGVIAANGTITNNGTAGWAITWSGDAVFDSSVIRGTIQADSIVINNNNYWTANGFILGGNTGIYTNNGIVYIGTNVQVLGDVDASSLTIDANNYWNSDEIVIGGQGDGIDTVNGYVYIGSDVEINGNVQVANVYIDSFNYWSSGQLLVGIDNNNNMRFHNNTLEIIGVVKATSGSIGNWNITSGNLVGLAANGIATMTISASNGGTIQAGSLLIGNNDLQAEDVTVTNVARVGSTTQNLAIDLARQGIYYSNTANNNPGNPNYAWSFRYNGTNVYAVLWNGTNYIDICISNCGATTGTPGTTTPSPGTTTTTTASPGTTTTTTAAPGCNPGECGPGCENNCGPGQTCVNGICMNNATTTTTTTASPGTTTTTTAAPGCTTGEVIPSNQCSPTCPEDFVCICNPGGNYCIGL